MKKVSTLIILAIFLTFPVLSQNLTQSNNKSLINQKLTREDNDIAAKFENKSLLLPNQFGYSFKRFGENLKLFFTFSSEKRVLYLLTLSERRAVEIHYSIKENAIQNIETLSISYNNTLKKLNKNIEDLGKEHKTTILMEEKIANMTYKHILILQENLDKVPKQAEKSLQKTIDASINSHLQAREAVAKKQGKNETEIKKQEKEMRKRLEKKEDSMCIQVIQPAINRETGQCKEFPTPCDVPSGWEKIDSCENMTANN